MEEYATFKNKILNEAKICSINKTDALAFLSSVYYIVLFQYLLLYTFVILLCCLIPF